MAEDPLLRPRPIFETLARHRVRYVVIGALGAGLHGSPLRTNDADICPARDRDNLERLAAALTDLDAKIRSVDAPEGHEWARHATALAQAVIWNLVTPFGNFDLSFEPSGTRGYDDLRRRSVTRKVGRVEVPVASLADIIRSKEAAGRQKDREQLPTLRKLLERIEEGRPEEGTSG